MFFNKSTSSSTSSIGSTTSLSLSSFLFLSASTHRIPIQTINRVHHFRELVPLNHILFHLICDLIHLHRHFNFFVKSFFIQFLIFIILIFLILILLFLLLLLILFFFFFLHSCFFLIIFIIIIAKSRESIIILNFFSCLLPMFKFILFLPLSFQINIILVS